MIYLRAAKKIYSKHKQNAEEEESYTHLLPQGWTLLLESTNGVHFNQGLQETTLNARLFSANGIDFTSQLRDITPLWSVTDSEWTATGWEVNLRKEDLPGVSIYASIVCKINFADVLRHFPFLPPVLVNIYQDKEIKGELSVYNPYSILTIIPDSFSVASVLAKDELFKVSVRGEKGDPGKSVTASEVVATLNTQQFRGTIKEALKADAAFVTATKGDRGERGERGERGVQGVPGAKGADGKSVTASEVVATLNTQQFRGTIKEALKADAAFVTATKGDRGERGLQGVQGVPGAKGADGKSVTASEVVATLNTQQFRGTIKEALKADAAFVTATKGDKGERGERGVQGVPGAKGADGKSVTASEVVATLNTQQFRGTIKEALKADAAFVTATKGDKGERGERGVQGVPGAKGADGKSVTASEVVATLNTQQFRGTIKEALKADAAFVTATKGDRGERGLQGVQGVPGAKGADGKSVTASEVVATLNTQQFRGTIKEALKADAAFVTATKGDRGERGERGERGVQGVPGAKGADGKSVTASEVVATLNTQQFRGTIKEALKADAAFVTATKGDRGERGLQGVQGVPGAKGADGKSVTASEVVATLNTQQFRGTIKEALKADAAFVTATKGDRGERGLQGVQGVPGAKGADGKSVTASEVVATLNTQQFRGTIKEALKADAAFVTATKGDKGERGERGVQGVPGAKGADGKSVTASEVVATLNTQQFRGTIKEALKADAAFVTATKGDRGERGLQGVQGVPGAKGADGKSVTASEVVATLNTQQFRGTIKEALKADAAFVTATKGDRGERGERGERGVQGVPGAKGADGKSVTASEVVATLNTQQFRGTIKEALKADAAFVTATKGDRGERGLQGVQGVPGAKGADGKSVTASEVVATLNTQQFRGTIKEALKADAAFVTATKGDRGERGLQGVQGVPGAKGADGKSVTASEVVATLNTQQFRGTIKEALKADAAFVTATKGDRGERGERGLQGAKGLLEFNYYTEEQGSGVIASANSTPSVLHIVLNGWSGEARMPRLSTTALGTVVYVSYSSRFILQCPAGEYIPKLFFFENEKPYDATFHPIPVSTHNGMLRMDLISARNCKGFYSFIATAKITENGYGSEKCWVLTNSSSVRDSAGVERLEEQFGSVFQQFRNYKQQTDSYITSLSTNYQSLLQKFNELKNKTLVKGEGLQLSFFNLVNYNSGTYHVKATDYHILARRTGNGDNYPYIRVSESLPDGHEFIVDIPFNDCRVRLVLPPGGSTWGNGGTEWTHGYRYHVTKSHTKEWGVVKTAYTQ